MSVKEIIQYEIISLPNKSKLSNQLVKLVESIEFLMEDVDGNDACGETNKSRQHNEAPVVFTGKTSKYTEHVKSPTVSIRRRIA